MNPISRDAGIPILTEVIAPAAGGSIPAAASTTLLPVQSTRAVASRADPATAEGAAIARLSSEEWNQLERQIRERILRQILERIDCVLEQRVRDSLADVLQTAVEGLAADIQRGLQQNLEEVISRAVSQEITGLQTTKN
jgi:histone H3/H4